MGLNEKVEILGRSDLFVNKHWESHMHSRRNKREVRVNSEMTSSRLDRRMTEERECKRQEFRGTGLLERKSVPISILRKGI